ncbi:unnamed protein product [Effrenium voratum]|uniref:Uncharacterized protein n=1 Tax=Effrenium voratum TaxID=2562239 RepID=A0AA36NJN0_9DINO|nr:unnamed protein product [Effrenium voratum]
MGSDSVHPDKNSDSSSDGGFFKSTLKPMGRTCCFWFKLMPPIRWLQQGARAILREQGLILACFKWLLLSRQEYQILKKAKELFKTVNVQTGCCADCPYKQLNKMERMYLHRILKDNSRWGANKKFIKTFQEQIIDMQKKDSDGGETITEGEFCNAALYAVQEYMEKIVDQMAHEIKKEYKKDEEMAEAP